MADAGDNDPAPYQSLYRRFRPQRFEEVLGQEHVSLALRNAVRDGRVGHAYLFSGPRGTGKTSTARILAKALNCAALEDGEPCGRCDSCIEIARGASLDVHELDAASNNGVDAMRDLVSHAALGTPGRWKVYIVDEVHMLSTAASNALLKTLEEPPGHVVFVLATTDAQKVLPTIRSRTQHFEFRLLGSETLSALLHQVRAATGLALPDEALDAAVRRGRGSARDALSALDQVAAGGIVDDDIEVLAELAESLAERDPSRALVAVAHASEAGRDPQRLAADLAEYLRQGFLAIVAGELVSLSGADRARVEDTARRMGLPALVRCLEELGRAQVDMRDIPDQRVHLEVALIKLTHPQADDSTTALLERVERLERALAEGGGVGGGTPTAAMAPRTLEVPAPDRADPRRPGRVPRRRRGEVAAPPRPGAPAPPTSPPRPTCAGNGRFRDSRRRRAPGAAPSSPGGPSARSGARAARPGAPAAPTRRAPTPLPPPRAGHGGGTGRPRRPPAPSRVPHRTAPAGEPGSSPPCRRGTSSSRYGATGCSPRCPTGPGPGSGWGGSPTSTGTTAVFALPNETHRSYCEEVRLDVEAALARTSGRRCPSASSSTTRPPMSPWRRARPGRARRVPTGVGGRPGGPPRPGVSPPSASTPRHRCDSGRRATLPDLLDPAVLAAETEPAGAGLTPEERLKQAFPGAQEV